MRLVMILRVQLVTSKITSDVGCTTVFLIGYQGMYGIEDIMLLF